ncbi:monovalent cation/H(+) antiporter subunit G [Sinomonas albida]|uniref:monovalent cation/H(+) antiporter subunit G n=1 Tax=Sinomonas albida TaxID=369942 RepID=UPI0010A7FA07|nr:monovalent cation/H(+) antiporter subunit G [Sinomonas albida]
MTDPVDIVAGVLMVAGALLSLGAAIGLLRFPDLLTRMHAATKPQVLGSLLLLTALGLELRSWELVPLLVVAWIFQLLTVPVSAHMVGRAGYRTKHVDKTALTVDELDDVVARVERAEEEELEA